MLTRALRSAAMIVAGAMTVSACGPREIHLTASPDVPAAESTAKVSSTDNGNTKIELTVHHLARPERVTPGSTVYVVWVRGSESGSNPQNIGALRLDDDLTGKITAVTPLQSFELFITAEPRQSAVRPTGRSVLSANVSAK